ncbi:flagellin/flagellar hook associated protein [Desulfosporosinus orientis DSM 765]|uniref:Flagellin n=1 Tax=Desulfosporosinus orientis (strain ATCC 19365 / DSM 765 / NCIMB 8382 / VKM B-1628 / Singapore I) TaxID=768706 RepID=G7WIU5_DESOD|nr:flagellin [Desulfosporosinus orientis]AET69670.1 flagellin/flagellar hook associated protein [Desulfosporosinus orientis DSM 765]
MRINSNIAALNTLNQLTKNEKNTNNSLAKLSSGLRINSAADDAAGLAISEKMKGQIRGLDQASSNSEDGISMVQTAEGALSETESILQRMRELAVQSSSDTNTDDDRENIQDELSQLVDEIDRISQTTQFNTKNLLDGSMSGVVASDSANILTNTALASGTTDATLLTGLTDDNGDSLGIAEGDTIKVSWTVDGELYTDSLTVGATDDLSTLMGLVTSGTAAVDDGSVDADAQGDITMTAGGTGYANAIGAINFEVSNADGEVNSEASAALSAFTETTAAEEAKTADGRAVLQIGANSGQIMKVSISDMGAEALGIANLDVSTQEGASIAVSVIDEATSKVSSQRSYLGAVQNRLDHTINNLDTASENLSSAQSQIADVDMAAEMMEYTKNNVLSQAATAMLAQANQQPQNVLSLLK